MISAKGSLDEVSSETWYLENGFHYERTANKAGQRWTEKRDYGHYATS
jgi:hypothetical protein